MRGDIFQCAGWWICKGGEGGGEEGGGTRTGGAGTEEASAGEGGGLQESWGGGGGRLARCPVRSGPRATRCLPRIPTSTLRPRPPTAIRSAGSRCDYPKQIDTLY